MYLYSAEAAAEDPRIQLRRRLQQQKCLVCGARQLANGGSYFCVLHIRDYRFCSLCGCSRTTEAHGNDSRCRSCASNRALAAYHANPDANIYRIRLKQISTRQHTRGDLIFHHIRRRIALADMVRATPGWSWPQRARVYGGCPQQLAYQWRQQQRGDLKDVDAADVARDAYWGER